MTHLAYALSALQGVVLVRGWLLSRPVCLCHKGGRCPMCLDENQDLRKWPT